MSCPGRERDDPFTAILQNLAQRETSAGDHVRCLEGGTLLEQAFASCQRPFSALVMPPRATGSRQQRAADRQSAQSTSLPRRLAPRCFCLRDISRASRTARHAPIRRNAYGAAETPFDDARYG